MMKTVRTQTSPVAADATPASPAPGAKMIASVLLLASAIVLGISAAPRPSYAQSPKATPGASAKAQDVSKWIGKSTKELKARLGEPSSTQYLQETGGWLLIYSHPGEPHYVFETGPDGRIRRATATR
jgi:hypothetical protein